MAFDDRTLTCVECNQSFVFTADDQQYHADKGYTNEPKRCPNCRQARRANRGFDGGGGGGGGGLVVVVVVVVVVVTAGGARCIP